MLSVFESVAEKIAALRMFLSLMQQMWIDSYEHPDDIWNPVHD